MFLANARSVKGKTAELTAMTKDYDIICITETHLDPNINSNCVIETPGLYFFRCDRNSHGGGVLIATKHSLQANKPDIDTLSEEMVIVELPPDTILCCYYRPHVSQQNISVINSILSSILHKYPNHKLILLGDMNFPGIDWNAGLVRPGTQYKSIQ